MWSTVVDSADVGAQEAILFFEPIDKQFYRFVAFSISAQHVVEMAIIEVEFVLEMLLKVVDHHILGRFLHLLEDLIHVIIVL